MHLVERENSKRLINVGYMRLVDGRGWIGRTIGGPDLIGLDESVVHERLDDLLH